MGSCNIYSGGGGFFVLEIQTGGGSCASANPDKGERGLKKDPIHRRGGVDFFWNNPFLIKYLLIIDNKYMCINI